MIYGIGTDLIRISRLEELYDNYQGKIVSKILSRKERDRFDEFAVKKRKIAYLAKRFAVKEAFVKALGTGFRGDITFTNISVLNNKLGKPEIELADEIQDILSKNSKIHVSLSDEVDIVSAFVIIEEL
jgi:holo-[acyl-carrier protein] synthase